MTRTLVTVACVIFGLIIGTDAQADKTYTPAQLRQMVGSGNYPKQGGASSESQLMNFGACVMTVQNMVASVTPNYPASTIVDTKLIYTVKLWTNDAAMTLSCSSLDSKLIITTSKYL